MRKKIVRQAMALGLAMLLAFSVAVAGQAAKPAITKDCPPIVFVHGLGGWGQGAWIDLLVPHWGMRAGSVRKELNSLGYEAHAVSVGPVSSTWDRACELYAQLTGTKVDYGEAHAAQHGHDRYGKTFRKPMVKNWSAENPVALVGHSFGGATSRMFTQLCEEGSKAERDADQSNMSPLFSGELDGRVIAVVTLGSPHNGSTASEDFLNEGGESADGGIAGQMMKILRVGMVVPLVEQIYPFRLGHFGLAMRDFYRKPVSTWKAADKFLEQKDGAGYELTIDGAKEVNESIKCQPNVYYFSFYADATEADADGNRVPKDFVWEMFQGTSTAMGKKRPAFTTPGGVLIDDSWLPNDGLVNVVSGHHPFGEPHKDYDAAAIEPGTWQVMPVITNFDHVDFGGSMQKKGGADGFLDFHLNIAKMIEELN